AIIHERHGDEIMSEHHAAHSNERQNADKLSRRIARRQVNALMIEYTLHDRAPPKPVEVRVALLRRGECIPLLLGSGRGVPLFLGAERLDVNRHAAPAVTSVAPLSSSAGRYEAMEVKLNSSRRSSILPSV